MALRTLSASTIECAARVIPVVLSPFNTWTHRSVLHSHVWRWDAVKMRNVTLRLPDDLLRQAKILGVHRESSLSDLMRQALEDLVRRSDSYESAQRFALAAMATGFDSGLETTRYPWTRDEVHDRD